MSHHNTLIRNSILIVFTLISTFSYAIAKPILNIYSYDSFTSEWGPGPALKNLFEKQCNCDVNFVPFEDGVTLFNRLRLEGKSTKADVVIGLDNNLLPEAEKSDLFAPNNVDLSLLVLPQKWHNHIFLPYDYGQYAFVYDNNKLHNPPHSLKELINRKDIKIIYQDPRTSTVGRGLLAWINAVYPKNKVTQAWKTLSQHTVTVTKGWSESYGAFLKGEADMVLSYNTSPLYHQIYENKNNYVAANFSEGHIVQIEVAAKIKNSKNAQLAESFLAFLLTPEAQKTIALKNIMLPVINISVDEHFEQLKPFNSLSIPFPSKKQSKAQINVWQQALSHSSY